MSEFDIYRLPHNADWANAIDAYSDDVRIIIINKTFYVAGRGIMAPHKDLISAKRAINLMIVNDKYHPIKK